MPYEIKYLGKDRYRVINKHSGKTLSKSTTLETAKKQVKLLHWIDRLKKANKDIHFEVKGKGLKVDDIHHFLHSSYQKNKTDHEGYMLDKELSGDRFQTYYNPEKKHLITVHKGTQSVNDWITNVRYGLLNDKSANRFKHAEQMQKKAEETYKDRNHMSILGHSLGAKLAEHVQPNTEVITLNKPTTIYDMNKKPKENQYDIKTNLDPVSLLKPIEKDNSNSINIKSKTLNPLTEHSTETLKRLNGNTVIGGKIEQSKEKEIYLYSNPEIVQKSYIKYLVKIVNYI
jgi:hypothetical protein